jgi:uncharacterized phage-associated protein
MSRIEDVAAYILAQCGPMTAMKLQKLCYYSQAWSLVWEDRPLFEARIEAWANGPVVRELYNLHRGRFSLGVGDIKGEPDHLRADDRESIDVVLDYYGDKSAQWLSDLSHREEPWRDARERAGLRDLQRGDAEITHAAMAEYYGSLLVAED